MRTDKHELRAVINYCLIEKLQGFEKTHPLVHKTELIVIKADMMNSKPVEKKSLRKYLREQL